MAGRGGASRTWQDVAGRGASHPCKLIIAINAAGRPYSPAGFRSNYQIKLHASCAVGPLRGVVQRRTGRLAALCIAPHHSAFHDGLASGYELETFSQIQLTLFFNSVKILSNLNFITLQSNYFNC